jgi:DNA-binding GntR family transcriptional regulator
MSVQVNLPALEPSRPPTAADRIFETLYRQVVTLELPPGTRLSEVDVAGRMGVSRQPVRDAFWRLSQRGFLTIRPQRATLVSPISVEAVLQARFIRTALEIETVRVATERLRAVDFAALEGLLAEQAEAVAAGDRERFHGLDDAFHRRICELSGLDFAWALIRENKAHMDRVRFLSLSFGAETALEDHRVILAALEARDAEASGVAIRAHLGRIEDIIARIRQMHGAYLAQEDDLAPAPAG